MIKLKDLLSESQNNITDEFSSEIEVLQKYVKPGGERNTDIDSVIQTLFKNKSKYPKELNPLSGEVYRGTIENKEELKKMKPIKTDGRWFYYKKNYKSKRGVQSFTYKEEIADKFATHNELSNIMYGSGDGISAIIITKVDNSFVVNYKWLYNEIGKNAGLKRNEQETFHLGYNISNVLVKVDALSLFGFNWEKYK